MRKSSNVGKEQRSVLCHVVVLRNLQRLQGHLETAGNGSLCLCRRGFREVQFERNVNATQRSTETYRTGRLMSEMGTSDHKHTRWWKSYVRCREAIEVGSEFNVSEKGKTKLFKRSLFLKYYQ